MKINESKQVNILWAIMVIGYKPVIDENHYKFLEK